MKENRKILIIDDDQRNIFALRAVLKARGWECISAPGAAEGIETLQKESGIGVVLMDLMMPDMDGYEAIQIIRANPRLRSMPIIAVTAQAMLGDREKALNAGADKYISKPINVDLILEYLNEILN